MFDDERMTMSRSPLTLCLASSVLKISVKQIIYVQGLTIESYEFYLWILLLIRLGVDATEYVDMKYENMLAAIYNAPSHISSIAP